MQKHRNLATTRRAPDGKRKHRRQTQDIILGDYRLNATARALAAEGWLRVGAQAAGEDRGQRSLSGSADALHPDAGTFAGEEQGEDEGRGWCKR